MACPHVSGIAALGLAYASQLKRHFTATEYRELMYTTAREIDQYFVGEKLFYMNHTSAGATPIKMNLAEYRGKMGRLSDAGSLLKAIDGSGRDMRIPNLYIAPGQSTTLDLARYTNEQASSATVENGTIADVSLNASILSVTAKSEGQTALTINYKSGKSATATITVRSGAGDNGWF